MKIPVTLEEQWWAQIISIIANNDPRISEISRQIIAYKRENDHAERQEQREREYTEAPPRGISTPSGNSHRSE